MVLCKFFQQGYCKFGSKCANEHFDVKQIIKIDVEAAINGKQWPFSCFGPFKDKPSIPNFIEDQSFEEIRHLCYEARQNNSLEQFSQQFKAAAAESTNKMKSLMQLTPEIVDLVSKVYNESAAAENAGNSAANPFGLSNNANANSIFGKSTTAVANNAGNIFGGDASGMSNSSNIFAQAQQQAQQPMSSATTSIFGGAQPASVFAMQQTVRPQRCFGDIGPPSVFTQPQQQQPNLPNPFGQQQQQQQQQFFNSMQNTQQTAANTQNIFAQVQPQSQPTNIFAQATAQMQQPPVQQQQQQQLVPNSFSNNMNAGIFAQAIQNPAQNEQTDLAGNLFQQSQVQQQSNVSMFQQQPSHAQIVTEECSHNILYSKVEDLTADEMEAFKAAVFLPGKIPRKPPPRELV